MFTLQVGHCPRKRNTISIITCQVRSVGALGADAVLDVSAIAEGYRFGASGTQILQGAGTVVGDLVIAELGVHDLGYSPGVQCVDGDYAMNGELEIEIAGSVPGDADYGYDQVRITGESHDASLGGLLSLEWSGDGWAMLGDRLWIVRNDVLLTAVAAVPEPGTLVPSLLACLLLLVGYQRKKRACHTRGLC